MRTSDTAAIREIIRQKGLRCTPSRVAVLRVLAETDAPLSHADVIERLGPGDWDRATLFRNLTDLAEAGVLRRTDLGDHTWRYEWSEGTHEPGSHAHFLCTSCGDVSCIPGVKIELPTDPHLPGALRNAALDVQLRGRCDRCA
jgi:Fur family ferric uptake transcriptional regulator